MNNLGFGMMRLPVRSGPTDFDYEQLNVMVDEFLKAGYTYFDTSFVYHNGESEAATRKALIERHPSTVDGTAAGLGISSGLSARLIASLKEKGVLREEERGDGTYYFLAEQRHD